MAGARVARQQVEANLNHFSKEDEIRGKQLEFNEGELDIKLHEQKQKLAEAKNAESTTPARTPSASTS